MKPSLILILALLGLTPAAAQDQATDTVRQASSDWHACLWTSFVNDVTVSHAPEAAAERSFDSCRTEERIAASAAIDASNGWSSEADVAPVLLQARSQVKRKMIAAYYAHSRK